MNVTTGSVLALFSIITLGLLLGKVKIKGFSLESAAVIFVGLIFGHFGILIPEIFQTLGLVLFVFTVGMQSGPGFLSSFEKNGLRMIIPTALMILMSGGIMVILSQFFSLDKNLALGLFTGGRSSNSALAVGVQSTGSHLPALGHSLSYPISILAILLYTRFLPYLFSVDLKREEEKYVHQLHQDHPPLVTKTYLVQKPEVLGKSLETLHLGHLTGVNISRIMHQGIIILPHPSMVLTQGDLVKAVGLEKDLGNMEKILGPESSAEFFYDIPQDLKHEAQWLMVSNKSIIHKPLSHLGLRETYEATATRLQRNGIEISPHGNTLLRYGDKIMIVAGKHQSEALRNLIGDTKRTVDKDILPLFVIILVGILLGMVPIPLGPHFNFSLGITAGVLISSLCLSSLGKTGNILWAVSDGSLRFVRQLGLVLFLGAVGTQAGTQILPILGSQGASLILTTLTISLLPLIFMTFYCRFIGKMNFVTLMGLLSGATTCSPALGVINSLTTSHAPNVAYATVYPFSMIFMMLTAQVLSQLFI